MAKANIFDKAKSKGTSKKAENHEVVILPKLEKSLSRMEEINKKIAELEAEKAILDTEVRDAGKESMIKLYNGKKRFPGTLKIEAGQMSYQFITSDRYKKIDEERFDELSEKYGEEIVEENTTYSFNTKILLKHMDHISKLLMGSKELSDEDKDNLLESDTSYVVKKGTIKDLFLITKDEDVSEIIEDIQPIFSIKSIKRD